MSGCTSSTMAFCARLLGACLLAWGLSTTTGVCEGLPEDLNDQAAGEHATLREERATVSHEETEESPPKLQPDDLVPRLIPVTDNPAGEVHAEETDDPFYKHLSVGLRYQYVRLRDKDRSSPDRSNYLGSIDKLNTRQADYPSPVIRFALNPTFSVVASYDWVSARTIKTITRNGSFTDGIIYLRGPVLAARLDYPLIKRTALYSELGAAFYRSSFDHDYEWAYVDAKRRMRLDNPTGLIAMIGLDAAISHQWHAHVYARYLSVKAKGTFYRNDEPFNWGSFPLDHYGIGCGITKAL